MYLFEELFFFLMKYTFSDFILHTFKNFKFKFYHYAEGHTFLFQSCYIRYVLLLLISFQQDFPFQCHYYICLQNLLIDLSIQGISSQFCFLYIFFIMNIRQFISFLLLSFQVLPEIVVNFIKKNISHFISFFTS